MLTLMADKGSGKPDPSEGTRSTLSESVADYAKREMAEQVDREAKKKRYWEAQKRVAIELPERFWKLAAQIRTEVDTFNQIVDAEKRMSLTESAGVAAHADHTRAELNLTVTRKGREAWVGLSELMRLGRGPTAYIIEAHVKLSQAKIRVRSEGIPRDDTIRFRVTIDGKEPSFGLDELGARIVLAVAKDDPQVLDAAAGPV